MCAWRWNILKSKYSQKFHLDLGHLNLLLHHLDFIILNASIFAIGYDLIV